MKTQHEAFALWFAGVLGICGLHRLYVGKTVTGLLWLFTFGLLGLGQLIDLIWLDGWVQSANNLFDLPDPSEGAAAVPIKDAAPAPAAEAPFGHAA